MNGRIYDPEIGRFISADPYVQFPESTQGYNRYTYVGNNPLSYTDPSGYFSLKEAIKGAIGIVATVYLGPIAGGAIAGYLATGDLKGAMFGMVAGTVAYGIGSGFESLAASQGGSLTTSQFIGKAFAHGISHALSTAGGGRFGDGFLGGFSSSLLGPTLKSAGPVGGTVIAAVVGGTLSKIGGGKFASGALSGAFVHAFNELMHGMQTSESGEHAHKNPEYDKQKQLAADQAREEAARRQRAFEENVGGKDKLEGLDPAFRKRAERVLTDLAAEGRKLRIVWGRRTPEQNQALVDRGMASPTSKHLSGEALDIVDRSIGYDNANYPEYNAAVQQAAASAGLTWGGNFTNRWDPNHIEMP